MVNQSHQKMRRILVVGLCKIRERSLNPILPARLEHGKLLE
jgi:hypothetical protein